MKKQKKIINAEIEYTVPFSKLQVYETLAKKAGCKEPGNAGLTLKPDGSAVVVYTVKRGES